MPLPENHGISEIHVVASVGEKSLRRIARDLYKLKLRLPKYVANGISRYKHHVKFLFYKTKNSTTPYMACCYAHGSWILDNDLALIVVQKIDIDDRNICNTPGKNWQSYGLPVKFGIQDYGIMGYRDSGGTFCLHANRIDKLLRTIKETVENSKQGPVHYYCGEEIDELEKLYAENIKTFVEAARFKGVKNIYIGHSRMYIDKVLPTLHGSFDSWLSAFSDLLGNKYSGNADTGLIGGGGNSKNLQYYNLHQIFPPSYYGKYYSIQLHKDELKEIHMSKRISESATWHDWKPDAMLGMYNNVRKVWSNEMANRYQPTLNIPEEALALYSKYLGLREKFFKKAGKYLHQKGYHIIESKWNSSFEVMVFSDSNYTNIVRIRLDERSNQIPGPWVAKLSDTPMLDIHSEDPAIKHWLESLILKEDITYMHEMSKLLEEVRFVAMSEKTMARLAGTG